MSQAVRDKVFISYSHRDREWLEQLQVMLKPLVRTGELTIWDDTTIRTGASWRQEIRTALDTAAVGVALVSADFLASDFITEIELPFLLNAAEQKGMQVCWVLVSACLYETSGLAQFQAAHDINWPLDSLTRPQLNVTLANIAREIKRLANTQIPFTNLQTAPSPRDVVAVHGKRVFRRGDRVRIRFRAGTIKREETGLSAELHADTGRTGTVIGGNGRRIVRVRWDPQEWSTMKLLFFKGQKVRLDSFATTINTDWLEVIS